VSSRRAFLKSAAAAIAAGSAACAPHARGAASVAPGPAVGRAPAAPGAPSSLIRIGSNENPFGPGPAARQAIAAAAAEANRYPFRTVGELADAIASKQAVPGGQVLLGSGSSELLNAAVQAFTSRDRGLVSAAPTFEMPLDRARELGHPGKAVRVDASGRLDLDGMLAEASGAGLVYICNPNNPTATVHSGADIEAFLDAVHRNSPDTVVLVDEAYHEFVASPAYRSVLARAATDPALVVTRTFSKIHGMAGLRVGYAVATPAAISKLRPWVDPINMNVIGLSAALASLGDAAYVESQRATNADSRARLRAAFAAAGYDSFDSDANFLMVHTRRDPRSFAAACLARGVQVARPFPPLLEHARITIGTPAEMERATRVFLEVLAEAPTHTARAVPCDDPRGC
jgi:histidinol-phosphate aminotransferase